MRPPTSPFTQASAYHQSAKPADFVATPEEFATARQAHGKPAQVDAGSRRKKSKGSGRGSGKGSSSSGKKKKPTSSVEVPREIWAAARKLVKVVQAAGVRCVCFDMDQCLTAMHSRGCLQRGAAGFERFAGLVTPDFVAAATLLHSACIGLGITTHSDVGEYNDKVRPESHLLGTHLVEAIIERTLPHLVSQGGAPFVVAYSPRCRGDSRPEWQGKRVRLHVVVVLTAC